MKTLLLGANGFIGKYLTNNMDVIPISRKDCDLTDRNSVVTLIKSHSPDLVINCASNLNTDIETFNYRYFFENLNIFYNINAAKEYFDKFINFGSGAEFDRSNSINNVEEESIKKIKPFDHYGLSKNHIANACLSIPNFYTLRLFGCFHESEKSSRLFKRLMTEKEITIQDRYFDYFWLGDLPKVIDYVVKDGTIKDMNLVYKNKYLISELVSKFIESHELDINVTYIKNNKNYTGNADKLLDQNLELSGIRYGMENYIK